ncbi:non-ribosomal peptide synthase domain TIGR01720/amino acid adenylation domain-containing protein [Pseudomonas sp. NFACC02]|uniref:non-ribosomal peptide synthase/polyketide synthase n=1 Tax=Pseudomonas sp. NFACC02 TaxID=1566250 RepID=UPI0008AFDEE8|nr:non-ribosomal peptide synthase/polyketide synthase [Pseudomonas sp. NFACC02]SEP81364.1 non-ribosomal peptide synthase domain TIGR01720/amino acid adenylation domain-containing protein [Pseudomonas sp. NFACC02]
MSQPSMTSHSKLLALATRFLSLGAAQRRVFLGKLREQGLDASALPIPSGVAGERSPTSFSQQRLWFLEQLEPGNSTYHLPGALRLKGTLDIAAVQAAFERVAQRHASLRTVFDTADDGTPEQVIQASQALPFDSLSAADESELQALADAFARRPFDLAQGPLWRVALVKRSTDEHVLLVCLHHIIADGWSIQVLLLDFVQAYRAALENTDSALAELPLNYADVALWQRACLEAGEGDRQLEYWKQQLGDEPPVLELPADRPRPARQSFQGARLPFSIDTALSSRMRELTKQRGVTLFTVVLAAYQVLLQRLSGQNDLRIGVPIAGRQRAETEGLIGFFVNTQILRGEVTADASFNQIIDQVRLASQGAQAHQDLPFEQLVDALAPERSLSHNPLFQVLYNHQQRQDEALQLMPGLDATLMPLDSGSAQFDLALHTWENAAGELAGNWNYATDLFDHGSIERLHARFVQLFTQLLEQPDGAIGDFELLDLQDRAQLALVNDTARDWSVDEPVVHRTFERLAQLHPQREALRCGDQVLTYQQLDQRANQLAHYLRGQGVGRETLVGVAALRSVEMVVALYAVVKAGAAYVPLDPEYPADRLRYMLEDAGIGLLLSHDAVIEDLPVIDGLQVLNLDQLELTQQPVTAPVVEIHPEQLAYMIYTSGSTGKPKGAGNTHAALFNRLAWMQEAYSLDASDAVLQKTPFSFDVSVWEFFWPLMVGARLVMAQPGDHRDPALLTALIEEHQITTLHFVPSMLAAFMAQDDLSGCASLKRIVCSGEALPADLARDTLQRLPNAGLFNLYGPTEAAIDVTHWTCRNEPGAGVPIGRPIANLQIHILDSRLNPQPIGVPGELYIGGAGLARGYHQRPGLTAERFVASPFGHGERLYRTGDLARWRADGAVDYLGRLDHQIKLRGLRVEIGEIESALLDHPAVSEAVVVARQLSTGLQLVGYLVAEPFDEEQLRTQLKQRLPDYMVPAHLVTLDAFPLSANGKLDRKALPEPQVQQRAFEAPLDGVERELAELWQDLLGVQQVGRQDNFFELGGDSILSLQIVSRARKRGIQLTPRQMFERQTIAELAHVAQVISRDEAASVARIKLNRDIPLTPIQHWFFEQPMRRRSHWNQSLLLTPNEALEPTALIQALQALITQHDALRMTFVQQDNGHWQQRYRAHCVEAAEALLWQRTVSMSDLTAACDEAQASLDLKDGPLLRAVHFTLADGGERLLLVVHHLVVDGVSWRILLEDLHNAYAQAQAGLTVDLGEKGLPFQRWANRLLDFAYSDAVLAEADYWRSLPAAPPLPCANPQGKALQSSVQQLHLQLDAGRSQALLSEAPAAYRTQINDLLLTALTRALAQWSGESRALIALEGHGREDLFDGLDPSRTVGWFTSLYPVSLQAQDSLDAALKHTKETLRAVPNGGLGYGLLRHLRGEALPSLEGCVLFNYMGRIDHHAGRLQNNSGLFTLAEEGSGTQRGADSPLACELSMDAQVRDGQFSLTCSYSGERHEATSIQRLLDAYAVALDEVIEHCRAHSAVTPSDFPALDLTQGQLDALPVAARDIEQLYPLTPMQQGLLFHSELGEREGADGARDLYINQVALDIEHLPLVRFKSAWAAAVQRHPILRASFLRLAGSQTPVQLIRRDAALVVRELDLRAGQHAMSDVLAAERETPFQLHEAPLMRVLLVRQSETLWKLVWTFHHILLDGWSSAAVLGEVIQSALSDTAPTPAGHYGDYVEWLLSRDAQDSATFWQQHLAGFEQPTLMATALTPPTSASGEPLSMQVRVTSMDLDSQLLHSAARRQRVTVNTLIQAVWVLLLQRYTGQQRVAFGATVSGRSAQVPGIERMLGLFINTLPLVQAPESQQKVGDWLNELQAHNLELREHEHTPLFEAQRYAGHAGRDLFDSLVVFENYPVDAVLRDKQAAGVNLGSVELSDKTHYPLSLAVVAGEQAHVHVNYHSNVFSAEQIDRLCGHFQTLLDGICRFPEARIGDLSMLTERDITEMHGWNSPPFSPYVDRPIHELIADHARLRPDAIALVHGEQRLTFAEFDRRANQLAHALRARGIGTEVRVAIAMERGIDLWLSFFAVLKAGGAYIPLDPDYPTERLRYMLEDGGVKLLISHDAALNRVPVGDVPLLNLDQLDVSSEPETAPDVVIHPQQLAYLIYTSGSTGKPKGAAIAHRDISMHIQTIGERYGFTPEDRKFHFLSISFDGAHEGWMMPMCYGARVVLRDQELWSVEQTYDTLIREGITVASFPPSYLRQLSDWAGVQGKGPGVKTYCFAGEAFSREMLHDVIRNLQPLWIINGYGPTETVVTPTLWLASSETADFTTAYAPIGDLVGDRQGYVMDADLNPLPQGIAGELYLGGAVARGYLDRPGATAERFLPHPFRPGERIYRSGDRVRLNSEGLLEYLGRIDHQIKIRGFRIEAGEIEAALKGYEGVREALVIVRDGPSGKRLLGYVGGNDLDEERIKQQLKVSLPEYMIPAHIIVMARLPQLPNGKLDRNALPDPQVSSSDYQAPQNALEQQLADLWQPLLGIEAVGRNDHFFELGGHSLLAMQLISRLRHEHELSVPLRLLFEAPRLADFAQRIAQLVQPAKPHDLTPRHATTAVQSFAQQRLWFLDQLQPGGHAYNLPGAVRLRGTLDDAALQSAFDALTARHEVLRTRFVAGDDVPLQQVEAASAVQIERLDISDKADLEATFNALAQDFVKRPFNLSQSPVWRLALVRVAADEQRLLLCLHHMISDGWSVRVLLQEFCELYRAAVENRAPQLAELPVQYADFAAWQREWLEAGEGERQLQYWREQLGDEHPVMELPTDRPRPAQQSYQGDRLLFSFDAAFSQRVRAFARQQGVTPFMAILSAYQVLLHRLSGQNDLRIGVPIAGRSRVEVEGLIGFFVSTQVLRADVSAQLSYRQVLEQAKVTTLGAQAHQDLPFEQLVEALQPQRSLSHNPLFQVAYDHQQRDFASLSGLPGLHAEVLPLDDGSSQFDLALNTHEEADGALGGSWNYATDLFDHGSIERLHARFVQLFEQLLDQPDAAMGDIDLLDAQDRSQLIQVNDTTRNWADSFEGADECVVHRHFERLAQLHPQREALRCGDQVLSYQQLDQRANQLAHYLRGQGVGRESLVGVAALRSVEMVVALYAVVKAGAAYVPLDPEYPVDRLRYMLEDAGIGLLLSHDAVIEDLPVIDGLQVLNLDQLELTQQPVTAPVVEIHPEQLAYMIYTSGSTGKPKGAGNTHAALFNRLAWMQEAYSLDASDAVLQKTPFSFDVSVWEFFWPLMVGARLVMAQPGDHRDPALLTDLIADHQITTLHFVPSMLAAFMAQDNLSGCGSLKRIVCSGEALPADLARDTLQRLPNAGLFNLYGPTEAAIDVTHWTCRNEPGAGVPIGRPIANLQIHILDSRLNPQPIGVPGELYIGGAGLARGYHQRPGLTAERFVASPFGHGERLYRTGDLARWRADGAVDYLGRLDHQIKLRGLRVEIGEIESALLDHPAVSEAVVVARQLSTGLQLVGYLVAETFDEEQLRTQLKQRLPDYMVPAHLVTLEAFPLSANGKLDRKALPEPQVQQRAFEAPLDGVERELAELLQDLLGVQQVGRQDNFFELGGHSLLGIQLVAQIRRDLTLELPLRALFEAPVLADLAHYLNTRAERSAMPALLPRSERELAPQSFAQQRLWFLAQLEPHSTAYNLPCVLNLSGALQLDALQRSFDALAARHESLRTCFLPGAGEVPLQRVLPIGSVSIARHDLRDSAAPEDAFAALAHGFMNQPFDLDAERAPWRVGLARVGENEWRLLLCMHHIISDGWSVQVMLEDFSRLYRAFSQGEDAQLPPLSVHYADYAAWQRDYLTGRERERQLSWWREALGDEQPVLELPADRSRPAERDGKGGRHAFVLPQDLADTLRRVAQAQDATLFMLFLAAFDTLLYRLSGQRDLRIGVPVAGRAEAQTQGLIGFFVNTLVLRAQVSGDQPFTQLLAQVKDNLLGAHAHQDLPFEQLVEALQPARSLSVNPLFQVSYNHQQQPDLSLLQFDGLSIEAQQWDVKGSQFDLVLGTFEHRDGRISGYLDYATDLFDASTVERLYGQLLTVLNAVCAQPQTAIGDLPLLSEADLAALDQWNTPPFSPYVERPIHELIADHARLRPDAIALVHGEQRLTFAEFDRRANQLAHALRARGIGTEVRVAIAMERGIDLWLSFFAVLKAGGAYIPLDPDYPTERLRYMLEDGGVKLLISHDAALNRVPVGDVPLLNLDQLDISSEPITAPDVVIHPQQLAYLIYTSGSTGKPKGAAIAHRDISMHIQTIGERYGFTPDDRKFHFLSISFDGAHEGWMMPMCYGARVVLRDQELWSVEQTYDTLIREGITVASFPPSYLRQLSDWAGVQGKGPGVKTYCFAGEAFSREMLHDVIRNLQPLWIINGYGPTETVVTPTLWLASSETADFTTAYAPIGDLVGDRQGYVMDADLNPLPQGIAGELYLGGAVARGYLDRPGATAERFLPHPFRPGERIYRSGDRVRLNSEGLLEYLGRIDHQIKIRGFRIEAGEIEAALKGCEGVREALVIVRETPSGKRLLGYVGGNELSEDSLKQQLGSTLPEYMVPHHIIVMARLPQLPNGKLDRNALPDPQLNSQTFEAPQGEREEQLARVWQQLLGVESIGRSDSFFELGGDSIQSLAVITRLRQAGLKLMPKDVFSHPRLKDLALRLTVVEASAEVVIDEAPRGEVPLTPIQAHFFEQPMTNRAHFNQALLLDVLRKVEAPLLARALEAVLRHHDGLNLSFRAVGDGRWQQAYRQPSATDSLWVREVADDAALVALCEQAQRSLDLENGPLLRLVLAQMPQDQDRNQGQRQRLLLVAHHLVVDGVSWRVLLEDLARAYAQLSSDGAVNLGPKSSSYQRWAQHLMQAAHVPGREAEATQWQERIGHAGDDAWPVDDVTGRATQQDLEQCELLLDAERTHRLLREAPAALNARMDEILLAALAQALSGWTGQRDTLVALEGHGREALSDGLDVGRTVGWFTSLFPVRVTAADTIRQTVEHVRETVRALPDKGVGFGLLRYLGTDSVRRQLAALPEPKVVFNYLGQFDQDLGDGRFAPSGVSAGALIDPATPLNRELEINGQVFAGQLGLSFRYSGQRYQRQTIERLQTAYLAALTQLLDGLPLAQSAAAAVHPVSRHGAPNPLIRLSSGASDKPPVFCVHPVSGTVVGYYALARRLSTQWDVWGIQNRQVLDGQWRDRSIEQMARDYVKALLEQQPSGTYRLIGWSMGGTMVLEMARLLTRLGKRVVFVGLIDGYVPGAGQPRPAVPESPATAVGGDDESEGDEHWQQLLGVERHMRQLANQCRDIHPSGVPVYAWWAQRSPENNDNAPALLEQGMGSRLQVSAWIDADHLSIVRDQSFITQLAEALVHVNERPQSHDFQEQEYA